MSTYDPEISRVETQTDIDDGPSDGTRWYGKRMVVDRSRGPLLTLTTRFLWRLGVFTLLSSPLWLLPATAIPAVEGLGQPWVRAYETTPSVIAFVVAITTGTVLIWTGLRPWLLVGICVTGTILMPPIVLQEPQRYPVGDAVLVALAALWAAALMIDAHLRRRHVDPDRVHLGLGASGNRRAGIALLLLVGLWVAAIRVGLPHRLRLGVDVDTALWVAINMLWLGVLGVAWDALPQLRLRRPADPAEQRLARARSAPPPKLAHPSTPEPARLTDLVLPEATLAELRALIRLIAEPDAGRAMGIEPPMGAILHGPPGTGKTLVARAVAGESGRTALAFSGAALSSKWVGESTERISDMFRQVKEAAPCVLVLDELDGIAPSREGDPSNSAAHRDFAQRINEILQQLEGVGGSLTGVFIIGATNHLDAIDPAVRSRLGHHIAIPLPDEAARTEILRRHFPARTEATPEEIAHLTQGMSGRDLRGLCRAASLAAFSEHTEIVTRAHFDRARSRVGSEPGAHATRGAEPNRVEPATFADLVLPERTMAELRTFVRLLQDPDQGRDFGAGAPQGAVLYGPPGTGKTLIARAMAGELGRPVLAFSGASLTSVLANEGAQLVRDVFAQARGQAPCVLFLDEMEGMTPSRHPGAFGLGASHDATQQINQFLQEIEGVGGGLRGVCVIGATNHLEAIDEAVLSRLSYHVEIPLPDAAARVEILRRHFPKRAAVAVEDLAGLTDGLSGRDLRELCKTAGMIAKSEDAEAITLNHFRRARERIGPSVGS